MMNFKFSYLKALRSLLQWLGLLLQFSLAVLWDMLRRKDSDAQRAVRLRQRFEARGGSFVKLGTHLSIRVDIIPWAFSLELARMQDQQPAFPVTKAIQILERNLKVPLQAIFSQFDPEPISSTTVANLYQAKFHDGQKVIVKVRRPGVGEQFMADLQAFDWLLVMAELLTIFRPDFTKGMRKEFRDLLMGELDFIQEARRQTAFRQTAADSRKRFFSAPKVYLEHTTEEVVVEEFQQGMWLWELLAAIKNNHQGVLDLARQMNIDPKKVAKRLLWVNYWSWFEGLFFIADPNPVNIIIGPNSRLYFINFAETGSLNRSKRQALQQIMKYTHQRDPQNMARAMLVLMEPLPPVDLVYLTQEMEAYNLEMLYAREADPASLTWEERTTGTQWYGFVKLARKHGAALDIRVLRVLRSTLYFEAMAVQLHHPVDLIKQYRKVEAHRAENARRRVTTSIEEALEGKQNERLIIRLDRAAYTLESLFFRTRHMLSLPSVNFNALMSKWAFFIFSQVRLFVQGLIVTGAAILVMAASMLLAGNRALDPQLILRSVLQHPLYLALMIALFFANSRAILFRMDDKEI